LDNALTGGLSDSAPLADDLAVDSAPIPDDLAVPPSISVVAPPFLAPPDIASILESTPESGVLLDSAPLADDIAVPPSLPTAGSPSIGLILDPLPGSVSSVGSAATAVATTGVPATTGVDIAKEPVSCPVYTDVALSAGTVPPAYSEAASGSVNNNDFLVDVMVVLIMTMRWSWSMSLKMIGNLLHRLIMTTTTMMAAIVTMILRLVVRKMNLMRILMLLMMPLLNSCSKTRTSMWTKRVTTMEVEMLMVWITLWLLVDLKKLTASI
jgi:hypothetical protein